MFVTYTGTCFALHAYGHRFEKDKPVEVNDKDVLDNLKARDDFEVLEPEKPAARQKKEPAANNPKENTVATKVEEGVEHADTGEGQAAE